MCNMSVKPIKDLIQEEFNNLYQYLDYKFENVHHKLDNVQENLDRTTDILGKIEDNLKVK